MILFEGLSIQRSSLSVAIITSHLKGITNLPTHSNVKLLLSNISEEGIRKLLKGLDPNKACGPDGISSWVLKELADEVAPILTLLFQTSMDTGTVPEDWISANIAPVFKKGEHYDPANYRPVSLTSIPCKIMEHVIVSSLTDHLEKNNILSPRQHGFRRKRSCETQLLEFMEELIENMEACKQTDVVIMDFAKASDKVNHSLHLHKLHHYGVRGQYNRWIGGFLQDRKQAVVADGAKSDSVAVKSGVPQGSVLGPSLLLVYINDLPGTVSSPVRLFADDTAIYRPVTSGQDQTQIQTDLQQLEMWEKSWDMSLHPGKCTTLSVISPMRMKKLLRPSYQRITTPSPMSPRQSTWGSRLHKIWIGTSMFTTSLPKPTER